MKHKKLLPFLVLLGVIGGIFIGCEPSFEDMQELREQNAKMDRELFNAMQERIAGGVTLETAVQLALKQNLQIWLSRQEQAIQREMMTGTLLKLLPELNLDINWDGRDTFNASNSIGLQTGEEAQNVKYSYSQSKEHIYGGFGMLWNIMDFGLTYFRHKQDAKKVAVAAQDLRRVRQKLALDVTTTYWNAITMRDVANRAKVVSEEIEAELIKIQELVEKKQLKESAAIMRRYPLKKQKKRISMYIEAYRTAKVEMAQLMGLPAGARFELVDSIPELDPVFEKDMKKLESIAILQRPELFQEDMNEKITRDEAYMSLLKMLPSPNMMIGIEADDNKFLYYGDWTKFGMNVSWNLFSIPSKLFEFKGHKMREQFIKRKRMAIAVAILTQLHLAMIEHNYAFEQYGVSADITADSDKVVQMMEQAIKEGTGRESQVIAQKVQQLEEYSGYMRAYARVMSARARVYNSVGVDPDSDGRMSFAKAEQCLVAAATREAKAQNPQTKATAEVSVLVETEEALPEYSTEKTYVTTETIQEEYQSATIETSEDTTQTAQHSHQSAPVKIEPEYTIVEEATITTQTVQKQTKSPAVKELPEYTEAKSPITTAKTTEASDDFIYILNKEGKIEKQSLNKTKTQEAQKPEKISKKTEPAIVDYELTRLEKMVKKANDDSSNLHSFNTTANAARILNEDIDSEDEDIYVLDAEGNLIRENQQELETEDSTEKIEELENLG